MSDDVQKWTVILEVTAPDGESLPPTPNEVRERIEEEPGVKVLAVHFEDLTQP